MGLNIGLDDQEKINNNDEGREIINKLKINLIGVLGDKKFKKVVQAVGITHITETNKKLIVNLYASRKTDETTLPKNIDGMDIEYHKIKKTELLSKIF